MKEEIVKVVLKDEPHRLRGGDPGKLFPISHFDEEMRLGRESEEAGSFAKMYEACLPKFEGKSFGKIVFFGTAGEI